jgi:hypothetical protein
LTQREHAKKSIFAEELSARFALLVETRLDLCVVGTGEKLASEYDMRRPPGNAAA